MATIEPKPSPADSKEFTAAEKLQSYAKERNSLVEAAAHARADKSFVSEQSNVVGSHVVYKRKHDGSQKARIAQWGHRDAQKDKARRDAPSVNLDSMRALISKAVEKRWTLHKMNVKSAYLQTKRLERDVYVRPTRKEHDSYGLWKLLVPAYRLIESERPRYLTLN